MKIKKEFQNAVFHGKISGVLVRKPLASLTENELNELYATAPSSVMGFLEETPKVKFVKQDNAPALPLPTKPDDNTADTSKKEKK